MRHLIVIALLAPLACGEQTARLQVPPIVWLGQPIPVTYWPDIYSQRTTNSRDWLGLYRVGECDETHREPDSSAVRRETLKSNVQPEWERAAEGQWAQRSSVDWSKVNITDEDDDLGSFKSAAPSDIAHNQRHLCWLAWEQVAAPGRLTASMKFQIGM